MIVPSDADYVETKLVKQGKRILGPSFKELADWIAASYPGVTVLNIYQDGVASGELIFPRLTIIFEWAEEAQSFYSPDGNFDPVKQAAIGAKFTELLATDSKEARDNRLLVVFDAFEQVARLEAIWSVRPDQLATLQTKLSNPAIWAVRTDWVGIVVFFHTSAQLSGVDEAFKARCRQAYAELISPYDEFGYMRIRPAEVAFDSKENFEKNYDGNWFNYDRR